MARGCGTQHGPQRIDGPAARALNLDHSKTIGTRELSRAPCATNILHPAVLLTVVIASPGSVDGVWSLRSSLQVRAAGRMTDIALQRAVGRST